MEVLTFLRENLTVYPFVPPVEIVRTGQRGQPRKVIDIAFLRNAASSSRRIPITELASVTHVHRNTLRAQLKQCGLDQRYSTISDNELDQLIGFFKLQKPDSGGHYAMGFLQRFGVRVQRWRIRNALRRMDRLG